MQLKLTERDDSKIRVKSANRIDGELSNWVVPSGLNGECFTLQAVTKEKQFNSICLAAMTQVEEAETQAKARRTIKAES